METGVGPQQPHHVKPPAGVALCSHLYAPGHVVRIASSSSSLQGSIAWSTEFFESFALSDLHFSHYRATLFAGIRFEQTTGKPHYSEKIRSKELLVILVETWKRKKGTRQHESGYICGCWCSCYHYGLRCQPCQAHACKTSWKCRSRYLGRLECDRFRFAHLRVGCRPKDHQDHHHHNYACCRSNNHYNEHFPLGGLDFYLLA